MIQQELARLAIFEDLSPGQLQQMTALVQEHSYAQGDVVFEQGAAADYLYILVKGEVLVRFKPYDGPAITVARVQHGGVFGWSAVLGRDCYTSAAVCTGPAEVCRVSGRDLRALCEQYPDTGVLILERLAAVIAERLHSTHGQVLSILTQGVGDHDECKRRIHSNGHE